MNIRTENINEDILDTISDRINYMCIYTEGNLWNVSNFRYMKGFNDCFSLNFQTNQVDDITLHYIDRIGFSQSHISDIKHYNIFHQLEWEDIHIISFFEKGKDKDNHYFVTRDGSWIKQRNRELSINNILDED